MRVPYIPEHTLVSRKAIVHHYQSGGELPGIQYGTGFFGNVLSILKKIAVPVLKSVGKAALPIAHEAITAGISAKGPLKSRLKAAGQTAIKRENLKNLDQLQRRRFDL